MNAHAPARIPGNPVAAGDNSVKALTPYEMSQQQIADLYGEARNWLDGAPIASQEQADEVSKLFDMLGDAIKTADTHRKEENKPYDEGKAAVQAKYAPLISDTKSVKGMAILAQDACRKALTPWRQEQERLREETAQRAREAAEKARREAMLEHHLAGPGNLAEREEADRLDHVAKDAETAARAAGKPQATGLRTSYRAEVRDRGAFLKWAKEARPDALGGILQSFAETLCAQGVREMPGVNIIPVRIAR